MNAKIDKEENLEINHRARHVIKLMNDWIKRSFKIDPIPEIVIFHVQSYLARGRGAKVTIPIFTT